MVLLVYGSLAPWQGWRAIGVSPFAFVLAPLPTHITTFDLALNVLAYAPLGALLVFALHPRLQGLAALLAGAACGVALSFTMEALQTYLPSRISSNLDFATNSAGALLGSIAGALTAPALIARGRLKQARERWFRADAAALLLLAALWPLAQIHPSATLFGNGEMTRSVVAAALGFVGVAVPQFDAGQFVATEVLITTTGMLAAGLTLAASMRPPAPSLRLLFLLFGAAVTAKSLAYGHEFGPQRALAWLTPGAMGGLAVGLLAVSAAAFGTTRARVRLALLASCVLIVAVNLVPANPYHELWLAQWRPGRMRDLAALADWLAAAWPYATLVVLLATMVRGIREPFVAPAQEN